MPIIFADKGLSRRALVSGLALAPLSACWAEVQPKAKPVPKKPAVARHPSGLVELTTLDRDFKLDIRYATSNNFTGTILYKQPRAFLQAAAAEALLRVLKKLKRQGFGLTIFDGYRPHAVTRYMWEITPPAKRDYVANPTKGSRHNRGCAVDLTMHHLRTGKQVLMPSPYDDFSEKAHQDYMDAPKEAIHHRAILREAMQAESYIAMSNEWWHFDFKDWQNYPIMDVAFEQI